jgi:hypothetical protein
MAALCPEGQTCCAGIVTAPRVDLVPEASPLPAQQQAVQRGAFGGREAVARLFGRTNASAGLPPIAEVLTSSQSLTSDADDSTDSVMLECASQDAESAGLTIRIPASMAEAVQRELSKCGASEDVSLDVESLLSQSLDSMLFGEDDSVLQEVSLSCLKSTVYFMILAHCRLGMLSLWCTLLSRLLGCERVMSSICGTRI